MKTVTKIDNAGRLVIPKALRRRFGFDSGRRVRIIPTTEGITIVPELSPRRFIRRGPLLTIETSTKADTARSRESAPVDLDTFAVARLRDEHLDGKSK